MALHAERRVWQSRKLGSIDALQIATAPVDAAAADACTIAVHAIGLNYADIFSVLGLYSAANEVLAAAPASSGVVPGLEFAGVIETVGPDAPFEPGDRVFGFTRFGAYTDTITQRAAFLRKIPDGWSYAEAASVMVQGMTAFYGLVELGNAKKDSRVLVESAAGGVGLQTLEICAKLGCPACAVVGSDAKADAVRARFPDVESIIVRSSAPDAAYRDALDAFGPIDVVMESLGGPWFDEALTRLAPRGRLIHFGATAAYGAARGGLLKWPETDADLAAREKRDEVAREDAHKKALAMTAEHKKARDARVDASFERARSQDLNCVALINECRVAPMDNMEQLSSSGLAEGEIVIATLPVVGVVDGPPEVSGKIGAGSLCLTRLPDKQLTNKDGTKQAVQQHRMHYLIQESVASFGFKEFAEYKQALVQKEDFGKPKSIFTHGIHKAVEKSEEHVAERTAVVQANRSEHMVMGAYSVMKVDNEFFHAHAEWQDTAKLSAYFEGKAETTSSSETIKEP